MWKLIVYLMIVVPLLACNLFNKKKIKCIFSSIEAGETMQLDDSDLIPILAVDNEKQYINTETKNKFISLQKALLTSSLLCGIHTFIVCILSYKLFLILLLDQNNLLFILWFFGFVYVIHFFSKVIFMLGLKNISQTIYLSPGHSVPGKSFFSFNPFTGFKYFMFSEQLDNIFGLFDNKNKRKHNSIK